MASCVPSIIHLALVARDTCTATAIYSSSRYSYSYIHARLVRKMRLYEYLLCIVYAA